MKKRKSLNTIELFCGFQSFSNVMKKHGAKTWATDNDERFGADLTADVMDLRDDLSGVHYAGVIDMLWASPPCQGFSVAVIGRNWNHDGTPKTDSARLSMTLAKKAISIIETVRPRYYFIENPRGMLRKMPWMDEFLKRTGGVRHTISYCQYGDHRQKPTDIWTNALWWKPRPICKPGAFCHDAAPRGSRTGTQGIDNAADRSRIPAALFEEIYNQLPR